MGIMDDIKFDINVELYGADTANRKYAVQVEQERAKKADSQKHSVPRKFLKGVAEMPEKMLNAELMGREVSNANNREQAIESERKQKLIQKQKEQNAAQKDGLKSRQKFQNQGVSSGELDIESAKSFFGDELKAVYGSDVANSMANGNYSPYGNQQLSNNFSSDASKGNEYTPGS